MGKFLYWTFILLCILSLLSSGLFIGLIGLIPGLHFFWIGSVICFIGAGLLVDHWFAWPVTSRMFLLGKSARLTIGNNIHALPDKMLNLNAQNILHSIEKKFCQISLATGVKSDKLRQAVINANNNRDMQIKNFRFCGKYITSPIQLISIKDNSINLELNQEFLNNQNGFIKKLTHNLNHTKLYLLSSCISNYICGALLRNWLNTLLTDDMEITNHIAHIFENYKISQLVKAFLTDKRAKKVIQNQLLDISDSQIIIDDMIINEGKDIQHTFEPDIKIVDQLEVQIDEQDFSTKDCEINDEQLIDSGSLEDT